MNFLIIVCICVNSLLALSFFKFKNDKSNSNKKYVTDSIFYNVVIQIIVVFLSSFLALWLNLQLETKNTIEKASATYKVLSQKYYADLQTASIEASSLPTRTLLLKISKETVSSEEELLISDYMSIENDSDAYSAICWFYEFMVSSQAVFNVYIETDTDLGNIWDEDNQEICHNYIEYYASEASLAYTFDKLAQLLDTANFFGKVSGNSVDVFIEDWESSDYRNAYLALVSSIEEKSGRDLSSEKDLKPFYIE